MTAAVAPPGWRPMDLFDPFERYCGPFFERDEDGARAFGFFVAEPHLNRGGAGHGGMLLTFADAALGSAAWAASGRRPCVTLNMQTHFLAAVRLGDFVTVRPVVGRTSKELVFVRGDFIANGETAMSANSLWKVLGTG